MSVAQRLERTYRVRFDECGPDGLLRSSGFLRFAQDAAWLHSESAGFVRDWYAERGLSWLVRAIDLDVLAGVDHGSELIVSTAVVGFRRVWARRRSEFRHAGEAHPVATASIDWVLLNSDGRPTRVPQELHDVFSGEPADWTPLRVTLPPTPASLDGGAGHNFTVRHSDLDPLAHVNNAVYLDYLDSQLLTANPGLDGLQVPRRYTAEFILSAEPGATLVGRGWSDGPAWCYRLADRAGRELLRARLATNLG